MNSIELLKSEAEAGNPNAQFSLGVMYDNGEGVAQDYVEAAKCFRLAAEQGHAAARFSLNEIKKKETKKKKIEPLFSCQNIDCAAEVSYRADDLRIYEGLPLCIDCAENYGDLLWVLLPKFTPDYEETIAAQDQKIWQLYKEKNELLDLLATLKKIKKLLQSY